MIHKLINHWTERSDRLLAESLRIPWFAIIHGWTREGAILVSPCPKLHSAKTWGSAAGGVRWGGGELPRKKRIARALRAFTVDLPDLKFLNLIFLSQPRPQGFSLKSGWGKALRTRLFLPHISKNIKLACCYTGISSLFNFESKNQGNVTKKKDLILLKDLISYKLKHWTKRARLIFLMWIYIFCYQCFGIKDSVQYDTKITRENLSKEKLNVESIWK